jgi:hypothetical protein
MMLLRTKICQHNDAKVSAYTKATHVMSYGVGRTMMGSEVNVNGGKEGERSEVEKVRMQCVS